MWNKFYSGNPPIAPRVSINSLIIRRAHTLPQVVLILCRSLRKNAGCDCGQLLECFLPENRRQGYRKSILWYVSSRDKEWSILPQVFKSGCFPHKSSLLKKIFCDILAVTLRQPQIPKFHREVGVKLDGPYTNVSPSDANSADTEVAKYYYF